MKCGLCGEELLESSQVQVECSTCKKDVPVHPMCQLTVQKSQLRVGCSEHPVTQLPVLDPSSEMGKDMMGSTKPKEVSGKELLEKRKAEKELLEKRKVSMKSVPMRKLGAPSAMAVPMGRGSPMSRPMGGEMAPWAMGGKGKGGEAGAKKTHKTNFGQMLDALCGAATQHAPESRVDYTRLDRLHDAWNAFEFKGCDGEKKCGCARCVTMDILTMTHIVEFEHFEAQLALLVQYITEVCADKPWALASLLPGKSNFWLCGWLVNSIPKLSKCRPSCLYLTSVNDTKFWEPYPWTEFRAEESPEPTHIFVLDDVSYSGTQFSNLLRQVRSNAPKGATIHACPLFVTPHADSRILEGTKGLENVPLWEGRARLLDNDTLFATLGVHRESKAKNFRDLCLLYASGKAWGDARWNEEDKTLTTYVPYYKIPDYFSCPERAYITPPGEWSKRILKYTFTQEDQSPAYKQAGKSAEVKFCLL